MEEESAGFEEQVVKKVLLRFQPEFGALEKSSSPSSEPLKY